MQVLTAKPFNWAVSASRERQSPVRRKREIVTNQQRRVASPGGPVTFEKPAFDKTQLSLALEASIFIGLAITLVSACLLKIGRAHV